MKAELQLHIQICQYIKMQYPDILFHSDYSAGLYLPIWLAAIRKKINVCKGLPDLYIFRRKGNFSGLVLELKKEGEKIYKKNGDFRNEHIKEQAYMLNNLRAENWAACFGIGFENTKLIIDTYLELDDLKPELELYGFECKCKGEVK